MSTKKLNKFVDLSKKLVNFKDYSVEEQEKFVSNAIAPHTLSTCLCTRGISMTIHRTG